MNPIDQVTDLGTKLSALCDIYTSLIEDTVRNNKYCYTIYNRAEVRRGLNEVESIVINNPDVVNALLHTKDLDAQKQGIKAVVELFESYIETVQNNTQILIDMRAEVDKNVDADEKQRANRIKHWKLFWLFWGLFFVGVIYWVTK